MSHNLSSHINAHHQKTKYKFPSFPSLIDVCMEVNTYICLYSLAEYIFLFPLCYWKTLNKYIKKNRDTEIQNWGKPTFPLPVPFGN